MDGSNPLQLTSVGARVYYPAWSPDGQSIVFSSDPGGDWEIYQVAVDGSDLKPLAERAGEDTTPVFSPDGEEIYILARAADGWQIQAIPKDGGPAWRVIKTIGEVEGDWRLSRPAVR